MIREAAGLVSTTECLDKVGWGGRVDVEDSYIITLAAEIVAYRETYPRRSAWFKY